MEKEKNNPKLRFPEFSGKWDKKKLGETATLITKGTTPSKFVSDGIKFIKIECFNGNKINFDKCLFIDETTHNKELKRSILQENDLLFAIAGATIGKVNFVPKEILPANTNQALAIIRLKENEVRHYIYQILKSERMQKYIKESISVGAQPNLNLEQMNNFSFFYPPFTEQTKIASFLSSVDKKLSQLKQKKNLLEQYKKGIMQKIFSQELRFKDDNGKEFPDWDEIKLGEIFYSEKGKGISKNKVVDDGNFECVLYGELYTKYNEVIYNVVSKTNELDGTLSKLGDLLIPSSTTTTGIDLANVTALNKADVLIGGDITILRSHIEINNVFYAYYLSHFKKEEIASYAQGSTIVHLYYNHIKEMTIHILSIKEQTKIANFLSAIDNKINHCQLQIEKTENWKKGLLQQMFC